VTVPEALPPLREDHRWSERLRAGDKFAFEELFRSYYEQLVSFASRIVGTSETAEEVVQEVFLSIWRNRARSDFSPKNLPAYLFGAVRKGATSHLRHSHVEQKWRDRVSRGENQLIFATAPAADDQTRFNEVVVAVRAAVDELPPRCRQAFLLRRQRGLSYAEIATVMGIAPKTVEVQIGAALRTLRMRLARFYE
jgi:RNA polymerase sigma-70 factor, ECF subfamily